MNENPKGPPGVYLGRIDDKGRLWLPTVFEAVFPPRSKCFVTTLDGGSVRIYPASAWEDTEQKLAGLPEGRDVLVRAHHYGQEWHVDNQRRVLVRAALREAVRMIPWADVVLRWRGDHIEASRSAK